RAGSSARVLTNLFHTEPPPLLRHPAHTLGSRVAPGKDRSARAGALRPNTSDIVETRAMLSWRLITTVCAAALTLAASAQAANITVTGTVTARTTLSAAANGTPSFNLTLNGTDQTATYTLPVSVIDARGLSTGGGWNLTVTSTQFSDGAGHAFPASASTITAVTSGCGANSTCT